VWCISLRQQQLVNTFEIKAHILLYHKQLINAFAEMNLDDGREEESAEQIVFLRCLDLYHTSPDSSELQCKSRA